MQQGDFDAAIAASQAVLDAADIEPAQRDHALLNLATLYMNLGDGDRARGFADRLLAESEDSYMRDIGQAMRLSVEASTDGSLDDAVRHLRHMATRQVGSNVHHYGVTMLQLDDRRPGAGRPRRKPSLASREAIDSLSTTGGHIELVSAQSARARAQLRAGDLADAAITVGDAIRAGETEAFARIRSGRRFLRRR